MFCPICDSGRITIILSRISLTTYFQSGLLFLSVHVLEKSIWPWCNNREWWIISNKKCWRDPSNSRCGAVWSKSNFLNTQINSLTKSGLPLLYLNLPLLSLSLLTAVWMTRNNANNIFHNIFCFFRYFYDNCFIIVWRMSFHYEIINLCLHYTVLMCLEYFSKIHHGILFPYKPSSSLIHMWVITKKAKNFTEKKFRW